MRNKNKYFTKSAKSVKKADYSYNGIPLKGRNSLPKESQLYPDEKNGIIDDWKDWSKLQSLDQIVPDNFIIDGQKWYSSPHEPTQRLNYIRNHYPAEYQTNAFENPPFTGNSLPKYTDYTERKTKSQKKQQQNFDNEKLADDTNRKIKDPRYNLHDFLARPYKFTNAENESSQFYQNMVNPQKDNSQIKQYAEHYYNPKNMSQRAHRDFSRFVVNLMTKLGYGSRFKMRTKNNPKDVIPADKAKPKTFFDI